MGVAKLEIDNWSRKKTRAIVAQPHKGESLRNHNWKRMWENSEVVLVLVVLVVVVELVSFSLSKF